MTSERFTGRLRRDLGTLESYAAMLGILIGAGIFRVTSDAWALTGPSVIVAYLALAPAVLATSVAYSIFLSTPLGREPGGEYTHIARTFGGNRMAFVGAWLKVISYLGALAYLSNALADYVIVNSAGMLRAGTHRVPLAVASLVFFYLVHSAGVRWFGRLQVTMFVVLGISLLVLVVPGLFAIHVANYHPMFTGGFTGFAAALPPLFFAYAGFESLAQTAGEVKDSTRRLPRAFLGGIGGTMVIFFLMSIVTFGVMPGERLAASTAPMTEVAAAYLPAGAAWIVSLGAIMALATSLNATMLVPSRLGIILAEDGLAPGWVGSVQTATGTPIIGLTLTLAAAVLLLVTGQIALALNIAVFALVILYFLHSLAMFLLPWRNPDLYRQVTVPIPRGVQCAAALVSMASMAGLILVQVVQDVHTLRRVPFLQRMAEGKLTALELVFLWGIVGLVIYALGTRSRPERRVNTQSGS